MRGIRKSVVAGLLGVLAGAAPSFGALSLTGSFNSGVSPDSVGYSSVTNLVHVHGELSSTILRFTPTGTSAGSLPYLQTTDAFDLDVASAPVTIGGVTVPAGTIFALDGDFSPDTIAAIDPVTGSVLSFINVPSSTQTVGGAYHPIRNTFFLVNWQTDTIYEVNPATGALVNSFSVQPGGSPSFDISYGDLDVLESTGELFVVGSSQNRIRVMSPTGSWLADYDVSGFGITGMSGIAYDDANSRAFVASNTTGNIYTLSGNFSTIPEPATVGLVGLASVALLRRRRLA